MSGPFIRVYMYSACTPRCSLILNVTPKAPFQPASKLSLKSVDWERPAEPEVDVHWFVVLCRRRCRRDEDSEKRCQQSPHGTPSLSTEQVMAASIRSRQVLLSIKSAKGPLLARRFEILRVSRVDRRQPAPPRIRMTRGGVRNIGGRPTHWAARHNCRVRGRCLSRGRAPSRAILPSSLHALPPAGHAGAAARWQLRRMMTRLSIVLFLKPAAWESNVARTKASVQTVLCRS